MEIKETECKKENTIPADKAILHLNLINRRIICTFITIVIALCVGFVAMTLIFTKANTEREKNILEIFAGKTPTVTEVPDGVQQTTDY
jgi:hypothetical protein